MVSQTKNDIIKIKYDGDALQDHQIDLTLLANALQGIDSLISESNLSVNGASDNINVKVDAFKEGSFELVLDVIQHPTEYTEILSVIGIGGAALLAGKDSLISAIKKLNSRKIKKLSYAQNGDCKVTTDDGETFTVPPYLKSLLASSSIRQALSKMIHKPLQKEGVTSFKILSASDSELLSVEKEDSEVFRYRRIPIEQQYVEDTIDDAVITFLTVHGDKTHHWRIDYEGEPQTVSIQDAEFIAKVKSGSEPELFSAAYSATLIVQEDLNSLDKIYIIGKVHGCL
ncbi:MAG: hypothetical protein CENE_03781 [Candidatus Celerinatantimonas neptuna]|nr:MAG: hypothetical protein CENE_03781 [Candidatus Celerinatantimonas neptuna]